MTTYAMIQARLGSTRFKNKIMQTVKGKTLLKHCYDRVKQSNVDGVYVICPDSDIELIAYCQGENINVMTGDEHDVLKRYYECSKKLKADYIVRITSDCPLICPRVINQLLAWHKSKKYDYLCNNWLGKETFADGMDCEIMSFKVLEYLCLNARGRDREHVTSLIREQDQGIIEGFLCGNFDCYEDQSKYRLTIDHVDDYEVIKEIIESFDGDMYSIQDIIDLIRKTPSLRRNRHRRNEGYYKG